MTKVVIFDDEEIVLDGVQTIIDWERWGLTLMGTATNGIDALEIVKKQKPDIIFTDIRMPGLDGLELIEEINRIAPTTQCVIMSGFNEIEYYKKAIQFDVVDYLEKPITVERIEKSLDKMLKKIRATYEFENLKQKWNDSQSLILEKKVLDILNHSEFVQEQWNDLLGINKELICGVRVGVFYSNQSSYKDVVELMTVSKSCPDIKMFLVKNGNHRIIIWVQTNHSNRISNILESLTEFNILIGVGTIYREPKNLRKSYLEALDALRMGRFIRDVGIIGFEELNFNNRLPETLTTLEQNIIFSIRSADSDQMLKLLQRFLVDIKQNNLSPDVIKQECLRLIYLGLEVVQETGVKYPIANSFIPHKDIEKLNSLDDIEEWLRDRFNEMLNWMKKLRNKQRHRSVQQACAFIEQNFSNDISLELVASKVKMNPSYFSILFKEEVGTTFIKYVTNIRIEKAKERLKQGKSIHDVSEEVGYINHRYFSELFKKNTGLTPGQYRKQSNNTIY